MPLQLRLANPADIPQIAALAHTIWHQHYIPVIGQAQVNYMLGLMYSDAALREQMEQKDQQFYLVEEAGETPGFVSVSHEADRHVFIHKFYLDQQKAGKGLGSRVFAMLLELLQPEQVRLTVNRQNFKSINFYFKNGFVIERVADFDIGNGYVMNDFVMIWKKR